MQLAENVSAAGRHDKGQTSARINHDRNVSDRETNCWKQNGGKRKSWRANVVTTDVLDAGAGRKILSDGNLVAGRRN